MAKIDKNASTLITGYIESMPLFGKEIGTKLREIILALLEANIGWNGKYR